MTITVDDVPRRDVSVWRLWLLLLALPPFFAEIVSGNIPASSLTSPRVVGLLIIAYSLPVLFIRELSIRSRLGSGGVFVVGLGYGIWNEGLLAQTLVHERGLPLPSFDNYLFAWGISWSWSALIIPWHALLSVLFPLALTKARWPSLRDQPLLGNSAFRTLGILLAGGASFLGTVRPPRAQMLGCIAAIVLLVLMGRLVRAPDRGSASTAEERLKPFLHGFAFFVAFVFGSVLMSQAHLPGGVFFAAVAGILLVFRWSSHRSGHDQLPALARFALGSYCATALFYFGSCVVGGRLEGMISHAVFVIGFCLLARADSLRSSLSPSL